MIHKEEQDPEILETTTRSVRTRRSLRNNPLLDEGEATVVAPTVIKEKAHKGKTKVIKNVEDEGEDIPEVITADHNDILRLKRLHEEISIKPKIKKRKREASKVETPQGLLSSSLNLFSCDSRA